MIPHEPPGFEDVQKAHERIRPHVHRTPVMTSAFFNRRTGAELFFKCENLQKTGAFKARGAANAVFSLSDEAAGRGVATHSSGNHGAALAYAAARRGIPATIVVPETAPKAKKNAMRSYGATLVECAPSTSAREAVLAELVAKTGAEIVHPYDDPRVIAGQGTVAKELYEAVGGLDAVIAPIGGGGLVSGTCLALARLSPDTLIYAGEPEQADDAARSFAAGRLLPGADAPQTIADGLKAPLKPSTWHFVTSYLTGIVTVSEAEIAAAMRLVFERMKIVIEPSAAVPVAALLKSPERFAGKKVGVILSGGNVDLENLPFSG